MEPMTPIFDDLCTMPSWAPEASGGGRDDNLLRLSAPFLNAQQTV